ncbi:DUF2098 domain-containing protein [Methanobrevibacter sp. DSM 116169]|uniref:DUF2098 domain-containing protein n=1 Tax=Methanobrevibacter sp. DSM 116169 TaxID=3242727 RepID=UPI0038FC3989
MQIFDARGNLIKVGEYVRYTGTGTIGEVADMKIEGDNQWIKLEKPDLWYSHELLEVLDSKDIRNKDKKSVEPKEVDADSIKQMHDGFENAELGSGGAEGGG